MLVSMSLILLHKCIYTAFINWYKIITSYLYISTNKILEQTKIYYISFRIKPISFHRINKRDMCSNSFHKSQFRKEFQNNLLKPRIWNTFKFHLSSKKSSWPTSSSLLKFVILLERSYIHLTSNKYEYIPNTNTTWF